MEWIGELMIIVPSIIIYLTLKSGIIRWDWRSNIDMIGFCIGVAEISGCSIIIVSGIWCIHLYGW